MSYNYKLLIVLIIPLLGLINLTAYAHFEEKGYILGDSVNSSANLDYINKNTKFVDIKKQNINYIDYSETLNWFRSKDSGICDYFTKHSADTMVWKKACHKGN